MYGLFAPDSGKAHILSQHYQRLRHCSRASASEHRPLAHPWTVVSTLPKVKTSMGLCSRHCFAGCRGELLPAHEKYIHLDCSCFVEICNGAQCRSWASRRIVDLAPKLRAGTVSATPFCLTQASPLMHELPPWVDQTKIEFA